MQKLSKRSERIGEKAINKQGNTMTIIEYIDNARVTVKFDSGYINKSSYQRFKSGNIKDNYSERVYGIGFIGGVDCKKNYIAYKHWSSILSRVNGNRKRTYENCKICDDWKNFENFVKWFDENYYEVENEKMNIDKDILVKGNKVYSPETCIFVPQYINLNFVTSPKKHEYTKDFLLGVCDSGTNRFRTTITINKKTKDLGTYDTQEEAFYAFKYAKEKRLKEVANSYKDKIPEKLYKAIYAYEVGITD